MNTKEIQKELDAFCSRMSEHVESIRIVVSMPVDGMTGFVSRGSGNYYAQIGSVNEWINSCRDETTADQISQALQPPEDDSEAWKGSE